MVPYDARAEARSTLGMPANYNELSRGWLMETPRVREYPIHPDLAPFVKCMWSLVSYGPMSAGPRERILPDSCVELVFHFGDPFRTYFARSRAASWSAR